MEDLFQSLVHLKRVAPPEHLELRVNSAIRLKKSNAIPYYKVAIAASVLILLSFIEVKWIYRMEQKSSLSALESTYQLNVNNDLYHEKN